ncbi:hypothetical protein FRC11_002932, partial [Ceratobasidium sp. 423]
MARHSTGRKTTTRASTDDFLYNGTPPLNSSELSRTYASQQPIGEIVDCLIRHGCKDITPEFNFQRCSSHLFSYGGFSVVHKGTLHNGETVAIKVIEASGDWGTWDLREKSLKSVELASALADLHDKGIVHGDVKADNVVISDDGRAQLTDFGSAVLLNYLSLRFTGTGFKGTLRFTAPELLEETSDQPTLQTDIYALGMTIL